MKLLCLGLVIFLALSCKKTVIPPDSVSSQLWIKVDQTIPDFKLTMKLQDTRYKMTNYIVSYSGKTFNPTLKITTFSNNYSNDTWTLVYKAFGRTNELTLQLADGKIYKVRGFAFKEKKFLEILHYASGTINVVDSDITIIEKFIDVE